MVNEKRLGKYFVYLVLFLALFLVMAQIVVSFGGKLLKAELVLILVLMFLTLIGLAGFRRIWGERVLFVMFWLNLLNVAAIWFFRGEVYLVVLFLTLVGFLMSLPSRSNVCHSECQTTEEPHSMVLEAPAPPVEIVEEETKAVYEPGKYVASKMGSVYHVATCSWAKKIVENRQVWFTNDAEAKKKGYKAHNCV